jgi:hypothetical protein
METAVEFERLRSLIKNEPTSSMPDSVRSRHEQRLALLRSKLKNEHHSYPLGAILVSVGAITDAQLNRALAAQRASRSSKLLGELLVDLGCIKPQMLDHALTIQRSFPTSSSPTGSNHSEVYS